jgi:hypothetical protein
MADEKGDPVAAGNHVKRVTLSIAGGSLVLIGIALLVLPGPGLLVVLAGLLVLASEFPALERYVDPVRVKAMKGADDSVATPFRIVVSVLAGLCLVAIGVVLGLGLIHQLPFKGWSMGSSFILSGLIVWCLLIWSYRRVRARRLAQ